MPIFRIKDKLIYFSHVPKAGGTSVANFFRKYSDQSAFIYGGQWKQRPQDRWSSTSPQHIDAKSLLELFPNSFFDASFAVVRHPEERILSEYKFRSERSKIHSALSFSDWLRIVTSASIVNPYVFDGHIRPQVDFILPNSRIFKLEDGFDSLAEWVSDIFELEDSNVQFNQHLNKSKSLDITISMEDRALITSFYEADYKAFGYKPSPQTSTPSYNKARKLRNRCFGAISGLMTRMLSVRIPY